MEKETSKTTSAEEYNTDRTASDPVEVKTNWNLSTEQLKPRDDHTTFAQMGFCIVQDRDECCPLMQQGTGFLILRDKDCPTQTRMRVSKQNSSHEINFLLIIKVVLPQL